MAANLFRFYRDGGAGIAGTYVATAPGGDLYAAEAGQELTTRIARITAEGSIVWQRQLSFSTRNATDLRLVSSANRVAVISVLTSPSPPVSHVALYDADGTLQWQASFDMQVTAATITPDNSVFVAGVAEPSSTDRTQLLKLNASTGAITWQVCANASDYLITSSVVLWAEALSTNDIVVRIHGEFHAGGLRARVQRISGSDGSVTWTRTFTWTGGANNSNLAVDGSDNIYVAGWPETGAYSQPALPVVKLDSNGATVWNRRIDHAASNYTLGLPLQVFARSGVANSSKAQFATQPYYDSATGKMALATVAISADGTTATLSRIRMQGDGGLGTTSTNAQASDTLIVAQQDQVSSNPWTFIALTDGDAEGDNNFGPYVRATFAFDTAAGTTGVGTETWTRATPTDITTNAFTATEAASTGLATQAYVPTTVVNASGTASALAFGLPQLFGLTTGIAPTAAFGAAGCARLQHATGLGPVAALGVPAAGFRFPATGTAFPQTFGTPSTNFNLSYVATPAATGAVLGSPWAAVGLPPLARIAASVSPGLAFGVPSAATTTACTTEGASTTTFGEALLRQRLGATALAPGALLGTPLLLSARQATGWQTTSFGLAQVAQRGVCAGFAADLRFGAVRINGLQAFGTTGALGTMFGAHTFRGASRTRSGVFRTQFGGTRTERTAP